MKAHLLYTFIGGGKDLWEERGDARVFVKQGSSEQKEIG